MEKNEKGFLTFTLEYKDYKSEVYGINKKTKNCFKNGFNFSEIVKLTIEIYSSPSIINTCHYLEFQIPIMHRHFF